MGNAFLLDTTSRIGTSGKFIDLVEDRRLEEFQALWEKRSELRSRLFEKEEKLAEINDPDWLLRFANRCRKRGQDFSRSLIQKAEQLEMGKARIQKELSNICELIDRLSPGLSESTHSLVLKSERSGRRRMHGERKHDIAARNVIIWTNADKSVLDTCKTLDLEGLPIPEGWTKRFPDVTSWVQAYMNPMCNQRVHTLISKARSHG